MKKNEKQEKMRWWRPHFVFEFFKSKAFPFYVSKDSKSSFKQNVSIKIQSRSGSEKKLLTGGVFLNHFSAVAEF